MLSLTKMFNILKDACIMKDKMSYTMDFMTKIHMHENFRKYFLQNIHFRIKCLIKWKFVDEG